MMRFFTDQQKAELVFALGFMLPIVSILSGCVGMITGNSIGYNKAVNYATDNGCELPWDAWQKFPDENATAACGEECAAVCNTAMAMHYNTMNTFALYFGAPGFALAMLSVIGIACYRYYQNKHDPEFMPPEELPLTQHHTATNYSSI